MERPHQTLDSIDGQVVEQYHEIALLVALEHRAFACRPNQLNDDS
jgi:hypothetical protein